VAQNLIVGYFSVNL